MAKNLTRVTTPKVGLTVLFIKGLKLASKGQSYEVPDIGETRSLSIRVSSRSKRFYMTARWKKNATSATSRSIGEFTVNEDPPLCTLGQARQISREWDRLRKKGIDPHSLRVDTNPKDKIDIWSFRALVEYYLERPDFQKQRQNKKSEREIRAELLTLSRNSWLNDGVSNIDDEKIANLIAAIRDRPAPAQAISILGHIRTIFNFALRPENRKKSGILHHPIGNLKLADFGLKKVKRQVLLNDDEIRAYWIAAEAMGFPYGPLYKLLMAGGQRLSDWSKAEGKEINWREKSLTIPKEKFKSEVAFVVPLSDLMLEILNSIQWSTAKDGGDFIFSLNDGKNAVGGFSKAKKELDRLMLLQLRKEAVALGKNPDSVPPPSFVNHDSRRVVRTNLAKLNVREEVAEAVIGHVKGGLVGTYNLYQYFDQKREALQKWADHLRSIVAADPTKPKQ